MSNIGGVGVGAVAFGKIEKGERIDNNLACYKSCQAASSWAVSQSLAKTFSLANWVRI
jgi:hypothetical protein